MTPMLDELTGRLRISDASLSALLAPAQGVPESELLDDDVAVLRAAGLADAPVPAAVSLALAGINRARVRLEVSTTGPRGALLHRLWLADGGATVVAHVSGELFDVVPVPAALVVAALAKLVGVAPRRLPPGGPVEVADDVLAALGGTVTDRAIAANSLAAVAPTGWEVVVEDLRAGRFRLHGLGALWVGPDGEAAGRRFSVLDTPHGLLEVVDTGGRSGLRPVRSTDVWVLLAGLLPGDDELAPGSDLAPVVAREVPDTTAEAARDHGEGAGDH